MPGASPSAAPIRSGRRLLGLRVDVDTHDGMRLGVPSLLATMRHAGVHATFYLSMGPDRSGLAVLNALRPGFLAKMRRTGAARVYGLRTMLSGTLLPARPIGLGFPDLARRVRVEGHEVGVHAWDHRRWQDRLLRMSESAVAQELERGRAAFLATFGEPPTTCAAPAWLSSDASLRHQERFELAFGSDCRGSEPFLPWIAGAPLRTPQVPATMPTLDEALGFTHADAEAFFGDMVEAATGAAWPVLTIHAELEGGPYAAAFARFLESARMRGIEVTTLGALLRARQALPEALPRCPVEHRPVPGRHGVVSMQGAAA